MTFEEMGEYIARYKSEGKKLFLTSSFQTHSIPLLHMVSRIDPTIPVLFINTGFLFPATISFKDQLAKQFGINVIDVKPLIPKSQQKDALGNFYFTSDTDRCCYYNKIQPLEPYLLTYDVWINGVRADQNANRANMSIEQEAPNGCMRFHPILDWTAKMIFEYAKAHDLPPHPMDELGYVSIGCEPCTRKFDAGDERSARWFGMNKTECGLHTDLANK